MIDFIKRLKVYICINFFKSLFKITRKSFLFKETPQNFENVYEKMIYDDTQFVKCFPIRKQTFISLNIRFFIDFKERAYTNRHVSV